mgnify:CR=1 FL=1
MLGGQTINSACNFYLAILSTVPILSFISLNMISAISNKGHLQFMILEGRFNGEVFETYLKQLIKYRRQKIFFVTDGHPAHKTKKIKEWLEENKDRIEGTFSSNAANSDGLSSGERVR